MLHDNPPPFASTPPTARDDVLAALPRFIDTERTGTAGEAGELEVWDAVKGAFSGRECLAYWRYPLFVAGAARKEPDILVLDRELGIVVIEVKSVYSEQVTKIEGYRWTLRNFYSHHIYPYQQGQRQLQALLDYCNGDPFLKGQVPGRVLVAFPYIRSEEWLAPWPPKASITSYRGRSAPTLQTPSGQTTTRTAFGVRTL